MSDQLQITGRLTSEQTVLVLTELEQMWQKI